jgi:hypothetical protein
MLPCFRVVLYRSPAWYRYRQPASMTSLNSRIGSEMNFSVRNQVYPRRSARVISALLFTLTNASFLPGQLAKAPVDYVFPNIGSVGPNAGSNASFCPTSVWYVASRPAHQPGSAGSLLRRQDLWFYSRSGHAHGIHR